MASKIITSFPDNSKFERPKTSRVSKNQVEKIIKKETLHAVISSLLALKILYDFHNTYLGQSLLTSIVVCIGYQRYTLCNHIKQNKEKKSQNMQSKDHHFIETGYIHSISKLEKKITPIAIGILMVNTLYLINGFPELPYVVYAIFNLGFIAKLVFCKLPVLSSTHSAKAAIQVQHRPTQNPQVNSDSIFFHSNPRADCQNPHTQNRYPKKKIDGSTPLFQEEQTNVCSGSQKRSSDPLNDSAIESSYGSASSKGNSAGHIAIPSTCSYTDSIQRASPKQDTQPTATDHSAHQIPTPPTDLHTDLIQEVHPKQDTQPNPTDHSANQIPPAPPFDPNWKLDWRNADKKLNPLPEPNPDHTSAQNVLSKSTSDNTLERDSPPSSTLEDKRQQNAPSSPTSEKLNEFLSSSKVDNRQSLLEEIRQKGGRTNITSEKIDELFAEKRKEHKHNKHAHPLFTKLHLQPFNLPEDSENSDISDCNNNWSD